MPKRCVQVRKHERRSGLLFTPKDDRHTYVAHEFEAKGRVQIENFVDVDEARAMLTHLEQRGDWRLTVMAGGKIPVQFEQERWKALSDNQRTAVRTMAAPAAPDTFRYMFDQIVVVGDNLINREPASLLGQFAKFVSGPPVIELIREITGDVSIQCAYARATRYRPGHFLTVHNDRQKKTQRRSAYVFGLTEGWRADWGGLLLFHTGQGDISAGKLPRFNVLNLFRVPLDHSVSFVSPGAPKPRFSISGWFRATSA